MNIDILIETICLSLCDDHYEETRVKDLVLHSPTLTSQAMTVTDHDGNIFRIEVSKQ
jgi:hypothetical protein